MVSWFLRFVVSSFPDISQEMFPARKGSDMSTEAKADISTKRFPEKKVSWNVFGKVSEAKTENPREIMKS